MHACTNQFKLFLSPFTGVRVVGRTAEEVFILPSSEFSNLPKLKPNQIVP